MGDLRYFGRSSHNAERRIEMISRVVVFFGALLLVGASLFAQQRGAAPAGAAPGTQAGGRYAEGQY
jgi:hypothetical protein